MAEDAVAAESRLRQIRQGQPQRSAAQRLSACGEQRQLRCQMRLYIHTKKNVLIKHRNKNKTY
jgi:hypothetical protein